MQTLWQDLRYGARMLRKQPGFTLMAVLTLALGIGANTAIFSVVNGVLLRPLPYHQPERLVRIWETNGEKGGAQEMTSVSNLLDWRSRNQSLQEIAAWQRPGSITLTGQAPAQELITGAVTANFFALLGVQAVLGRTFVPEEGLAGRTRVVVLSHALWSRLFAADPQIVGKQIQLDGLDFQVVGVMPLAFNSPAGDAALWLPINLTPNKIDRGQTYLQAIARLKPGGTLAQAQADASNLAAELARQFPASNRARGLALIPLLQATVGEARSAVLIVFGAVLFVLLIACANVANLFLVRAAGREREIAVRAALGASRLRLMRQLLTESLLVAAAGGVLGSLVALWSLELLRNLGPSDLPRLNEVGIDAPALLFAVVVSLLAGIVCGLAPALHACTPQLSAALKNGKQGQGGSVGRQRLRDAFVVVQLAFALVLLIGAGLLVKSYLRLSNVPAGFNPNNLLVVRMFLDGVYSEDRRQVGFFRELTQRLKSLPGVTAAGAATVLPLNPVGIDFDVPWQREGEPEPARANAPKARFRSATPDYFQAIGISLVRGRTFTERDLGTAPRVVMVNQALAERAWPGENPVGKRLRFFWADWQTYEVVGVTGNTKSYGLAAEWRPELFVPHAQLPYTVMNVVIRTASDPASLAAAVRSAILELDASQPPHSIITMEELFARSLAKERFALALLEVLAGLALLLAVVGVYGVLSFAVRQRTPEIGIRLALGATAPDIQRLVLRQGLRLALCGVVTGLAAALILTRWLETLLFNLSATDPLTFAGVALLLTCVALLACWLPAWRATKVDPLVALRYE